MQQEGATGVAGMARESVRKARLLSPAKAGEELGITRQRVNKLAERWPEIRVDGLIDVERLRTLRAENADPAKLAAYEQARARLSGSADVDPTVQPVQQKRADKVESEAEAPEQGVLNFNEAKTARERANARLAELRVDEAEGRLIDREQMIAVNFAIARKLRDRINGFPTRLQQFLPGDAMQMLVDECTKLVEELQADAAKIAEDGV